MDRLIAAMLKKGMVKFRQERGGSYTSFWEIPPKSLEGVHVFHAQGVTLEAALRSVHDKAVQAGLSESLLE